MTDAELAAELADEAGRLLIALRGPGCPEGVALGDMGDHRANDFILDRLRAARPDDAILSEESLDDPARLKARRVWIVDPLDGTREYCEHRPDWAVHIALAVDGAAAVGAVAVPARGLVFRSDRAAPPPPSPRAKPLMLVSRSRPCDEAARVAEHLGADIAEMGSAGAKAMAVVAGEADLYVHSGGQHEWDNCAPVAVALAAGLHASRLDGAPLVYNRPDPRVPDLIIARLELGARVVAFLSSRSL